MGKTIQQKPTKHWWKKWKENLNKLRDMPSSLIGRWTNIKISVLTKRGQGFGGSTFNVQFLSLESNSHMHLFHFVEIDFF